MPGNEERRAFADAFIQEHSQRFGVHARRFHGWLRPADIADVAAQATLRVYQYLLDGGVVRTSASGLIRQAVRNAAIDQCRKERRHPPVNPDIDPEQLPDRSSANDRLAEVNACLAELERKQRLALVLFGVYGLTHAAIGERLGITENNSRQTVFRAARNLKALLAARGITVESEG